MHHNLLDWLNWLKDGYVDSYPPLKALITFALLAMLCHGQKSTIIKSKDLIFVVQFICINQ